MEKTLKVKPLVLSIFISSICSIVYELIIAGISSYLLGNSIKQFSITIGLYMCSMGIGSYLSQYIKRNLFDTLVWVQIGAGIVGGMSALLLFSSYSFTKVYVLLMYAVIIIIGIFVGLEVPILTRIVEEYNKDLRITLANILSFDYMGSLLGSIAFPLFLFPHLGFIRTSFLMGVLNIGVAGIMIFMYPTYLSKSKSFVAIFWCCLVLLVGGLVFGDYSADQIEQHLYRDQIIFSKQTMYQKIVVTKHRDDIRLFLDGNIQFSSNDEYRYHEALVHPVMSLAPRHEKILVLGGGDGFVTRELSKYPMIKKMVLVDIDEDMVAFSKTNPLIKKLNEGALEHPKLTIHYEDAFKFLEESDEAYDIIIVDLPDPNNESLNKLYTDVFYRLIGNHLSKGGFFVAQSTSPYYATEAFWCIHKTIQKEGFHTKAYHVQVPSFGEWGFQIASKNDFQYEDISIQVPTRFLTDNMIPGLFSFAKDETVDLQEIEVNRISHPVLLRYYEKAEAKF